MKGIIVSTDAQSLGNVEDRMIGLNKNEYHIKCIYDSKFDTTAFSLCLKKLTYLKVKEISFQGIPEKYLNKTLNKTIERHFTGSYKFIEEKKIDVVMTESDYARYEAWKKNPVVSLDVSKLPDVGVQTVVKDGRIESVQMVEKKAPANFKTIYDMDGIEIKPRSQWIYNQSLCRSEETEIIVKSVNKLGVIPMQTMKLPRYSLNHFGEGRAFVRYVAPLS